MLLTEDQSLIRDMARSFSQEKIAPNARAWEEARGFPADILGEMGELGFFGMTVPEEWGGAGADYVSYALALMEIAAGDGGLSTVMSVNNAPMCAALMRNGSEAQKEKFLKPMAQGQIIGAFCLTEAHAGSDASALRTRARKVEGGYVINGAKQFITSGELGGCALIFAVTDPAAGKRGLSAFIVDTKTPGYIVDKVEHKMGQKASDTCALRFEEMFVPDDGLVGAEGEGYAIALANLEAGRIGIAAQCVGMAQAALDAAVQYAKDRTSFGKPIMSHQAVGHRLAAMAAKLEASRHLVLHAAALRSAGAPCLKEACMAKLIASESAEEIVSACLQTLGGYGYVEDFIIEKIYRDVRVCQIYEGASDIQHMIIARSL